MIDLYLLDTSAIIAYLEAEDGGIRVRELLGSEKTLLPFVVVLEVHYVTTRRKGSAGALERLTALKSLPSTWLHTVDEATLLAASRIKAAHHLSLPTLWWPGSQSARQPSWFTKIRSLTP